MKSILREVFSKLLKAYSSRRHWELRRLCIYGNCDVFMREAPCWASDCPHRTVWAPPRQEASKPDPKDIFKKK